MFMMVYIASDQSLPTVAWDDAHPAFYVSELMPDREPVRRQFSAPNVYYVGSHEGCGCGFQCDELHFPDPDAPPEVVAADAADLAERQDSLRRFASYLTQALDRGATVDVYACWAGDEAAAPAFRESLRPDDLLDARPYFREKELLRVVR